MKRRVKSDEYSGHGLPVGAVVEDLDPADLPAYLRDSPDAQELNWYTQGGDGDERAIDPKDLEDLPVGYRWATEDETEAQLPYAIVVPRTFDSLGNEYTQDEADIAVPEQWWHCFGGVNDVGEMAGLWMQVMAGPTRVPPEGTNDSDVPIQEIFRESNPYLNYLGSFTYEPSDMEKDRLAPEDYRTWDDEGNEIPWAE